MKTVFVDTFYFLALLSPSDQAHGKAVEFTSSNPVRMVTTEWVLEGITQVLTGDHHFEQAGFVALLKP